MNFKVRSEANTSPPDLVHVRLLKRLRALLLWTTQYAPARRLFAPLYWLSIRLAASKLKKLPAVTHIFLRRSLAKGESWPLLSDVDFTIVTQDTDSAASVRSALSRLSRWLPLIEPQSPVLTADELGEKLHLQRFRQEVATLYRYFEAQHTWELLYQCDTADDLDLTCQPDSYQLDVLVLHELQYWNGIVVAFHTDYLGQKSGFQSSLAMAWICFKAILEVDNLVAHFEGSRKLDFSRRAMLQAALRSHLGARWESLLKQSQEMLRGRRPRDLDEYIRTAHQFLASRHADLLRVFTDKTEQELPYLSRLRETLAAETPPQPPIEQVNFDANNVEIPPELLFEDLEIVWLTPQPRTDTSCQLLLLIVVKSFGSDSRRQVATLCRALDAAIRVSAPTEFHVEVSVNQLDCFLNMSVPRQFGLEKRVLYARQADYRPCLFEIVFAIQEQECLRRMRQLQKVASLATQRR